MRPTLEQLYRNPEFFIKVLSDHGVQAAHPKVTALQTDLQNYFNLRGWIQQIEDEIRVDQQSFLKKFLDSKSRGNLPEKWYLTQRKSLLKRSGGSKRSLMAFRQSYDFLEKKISKKISGWPDLDYDEKKLKKSGTTKKYRKQVLRTLKRRARKYPRFFS